MVTRLQDSRFFLKVSKEIGKAWRRSLAREARERVCEAREEIVKFSASK